MHTPNPLSNIFSFLMASQVLLALTLQASALWNPVIKGIEMENQPDKKEMDWETELYEHLKYRRKQWSAIYLHKNYSQASAWVHLNLELL